MAKTSRRGLMLVLSSPSGAGKTTLSRRLLAQDGAITMSVSATTRAQRPGETPGTDYDFVSLSDFEARIAKDDFLEHALVFGHRYGTPKGPVAAALGEGRDVLFDIDWQGTQQLRERARDDVVSIFILPPSRAALEQRLHTRAQDSQKTVAARMAKADDEMSHWAEYDYVVINDDLERCLAEIVSILKAERLRRHRQTALSDFVRGLMKG
ncbi:MAG: guanylate kinase [Alphaproteobacteria bacterium]|nr:guanylate kinase [Alphaproteobacteria bacterium]